MSTTSSKRSVPWAVIALATLVALPAISHAAPPPQVALVNVTPGSVAWAPVVGFDKLVLTVSGQGFTKSYEFEAGGVSFTPVDDEGYLLPDGSYSWELTVIPTAATISAGSFRSEKVSADGRAHQAAQVPAGLKQSGTFTISGGAIADPNLVEVERGASISAKDAMAPAAAEIDDTDGGSQ